MFIWIYLPSFRKVHKWISASQTYTFKILYHASIHSDSLRSWAVGPQGHHPIEATAQGQGQYHTSSEERDLKGTTPLSPRKAQGRSEYHTSSEERDLKDAIPSPPWMCDTHLDLELWTQWDGALEVSLLTGCVILTLTLSRGLSRMVSLRSLSSLDV